MAFDGHLQSALAGVQIIDHVAWIKLIAVYICLLDLNGFFSGFFLFRCKIFHTEDGCRATSQVGPVTPPKQYSKQMLKGHYEIKHIWRYLLEKQGVQVKPIPLQHY